MDSSFSVVLTLLLTKLFPPIRLPENTAAPINGPTKGIKQHPTPSAAETPTDAALPPTILLLAELLASLSVTSFGNALYIISLISLYCSIRLQKNSDSFSEGPSFDKTYFSILQYLSSPLSFLDKYSISFFLKNVELFLSLLFNTLNLLFDNYNNLLKSIITGSS